MQLKRLKNCLLKEKQRELKHLYLLRYATEGIKAACDWAYKGVSEGSVLEGK